MDFFGSSSLDHLDGDIAALGYHVQRLRQHRADQPENVRKWLLYWAENGKHGSQDFSRIKPNEKFDISKLGEDDDAASDATFDSDDLEYFAMCDKQMEADGHGKSMITSFVGGSKEKLIEMKNDSQLKKSNKKNDKFTKADDVIKALQDLNELKTQYNALDYDPYDWCCKKTCNAVDILEKLPFHKLANDIEAIKDVNNKIKAAVLFTDFVDYVMKDCEKWARKLVNGAEGELNYEFSRIVIRLWEYLLSNKKVIDETNVYHIRLVFDALPMDTIYAEEEWNDLMQNLVDKIESWKQWKVPQKPTTNAIRRFLDEREMAKEDSSEDEDEVDDSSNPKKQKLEEDLSKKEKDEVDDSSNPKKQKLEEDSSEKP